MSSTTNSAASASASPAAETAASTEGSATTPPAPPPPKAGQWHEDLGRAIQSLEKELATAGSETNADERARLDGTLRLLYVAAQRRDDAVRPIESLEGREQDFWQLALGGFLELLDPNGPPVLNRRAKLALRSFREAVHQLAAASSLEVRNLAICRRVDSYGQYTEFSPYEFTPEQEVILYVEVGNFAAEAKDEGYETELQGSYQILDHTGRRLADYDLMLDLQVCRNLRTDYFLPYRIFLPKNLEPGSYKIQVTVEDKKGAKFGQSPPVDFRIRK